MTWSELKDFCNKLPESQLTRNVILWREDEGINKIEPVILEDDYYIDEENTCDGCFPESEASEPIECYKKVYDKGDAILMEDF